MRSYSEIIFNPQQHSPEQPMYWALGIPFVLKGLPSHSSTPDFLATSLKVLKCFQKDWKSIYWLPSLHLLAFFVDTLLWQPFVHTVSFMYCFEKKYLTISYNLLTLRGMHTWGVWFFPYMAHKPHSSKLNLIHFCWFESRYLMFSGYCGFRHL